MNWCSCKYRLLMLKCCKALHIAKAFIKRSTTYKSIIRWSHYLHLPAVFEASSISYTRCTKDIDLDFFKTPSGSFHRFHPNLTLPIVLFHLSLIRENSITMSIPDPSWLVNQSTEPDKCISIYFYYFIKMCKTYQSPKGLFHCYHEMCFLTAKSCAFHVHRRLKKPTKQKQKNECVDPRAR